MSYIFISYAREDEVIANKIKKAIEFLEIETWLDTKRLRPAYKWSESIEIAINGAAGAVFIVSNHSIGKESYIQQELDLLLCRAAKQTPFLLPIRIDPVDLVNHPLGIIHYTDFFNGDFSYIGLMIHEFSLTFREMIAQHEKQIEHTYKTKKQVENEIEKAEYKLAEGTSGRLFLPEELDIYANKVTLETFIFHGKLIDYEEIDYLEFDHANNSMIVIMTNGVALDLGVRVQWLLRPYVRSTAAIQMARTRNGEQIDGKEFPLVHRNQDLRFKPLESKRETIKRIMAVTSLEKPKSRLATLFINWLRKNKSKW